MSATLAVTGSTGALGGLVARSLSEAGLAPLLIVRDASRAPDLAGSEVRVASYGDSAASIGALHGVETLFMVSGSESVDRLVQHRAFVLAAAEAGVKHIVYTSFAAASPDSIFTLGRDHATTEDYIRQTGMDFTFLRDNFYLDFFQYLPGEDGIIRGPAGDGRVAGVARADVARVAVQVLRDPAAHRGRTYDLTGPEALTLTEVADALSRVTGREIRFQNETLDEAYESRAVYDAPRWQTDAWVSTYTSIAGGEVAEVSDDIERVTGRAPMTFEELLRRT